LINFVPIDSTAFPGGIVQSQANNQISLKDITTIAIEVPISCVTGGNDGIIGVWTASRGKKSGKQRARLANPLVNELLVGLKDKAKYNRGVPSEDSSFITKYIQYPTLPFIIDLLFRAAVNTGLGTNIANLAPNNFPRLDLTAVILTGIPGLNQPANQRGRFYDVMRLNTNTPVTPYGTQNTLGVIGGDNAGYPNGRRPGDDVVDITLRAVMGVLCHAGLGVCEPANAPIGTAALTDGAPLSDVEYLPTFPYFNLPNPGA